LAPSRLHGATELEAGLQGGPQGMPGSLWLKSGREALMAWMPWLDCQRHYIASRYFIRCSRNAREPGYAARLPTSLQDDHRNRGRGLRLGHPCDGWDQNRAVGSL